MKIRIFPGSTDSFIWTAGWLLEKREGSTHLLSWESAGSDLPRGAGSMEGAQQRRTSTLPREAKGKKLNQTTCVQ